jgi:hypothetical protein
MALFQVKLDTLLSKINSYFLIIKALITGQNSHYWILTLYFCYFIHFRCSTALILLAEEDASTIVDAEKLFKQAYKYAEVQYKKSQQTQHQGSTQEAIHSMYRALCIVFYVVCRQLKYTNIKKLWIFRRFYKQLSYLRITGRVGSNPVRSKLLFPWVRNFTLFA